MRWRQCFEKILLGGSQGIDQLDVERTRGFVIDDVVFQPDIDMPMRTESACGDFGGDVPLVVEGSGWWLKPSGPTEYGF
jgi:hypothetical protein